MKVTASQAQEIKSVLKSIPDSRKAKGLRHSQASVLAIALCGVLSGCRSFIAIGEWASRCIQKMLRRLGCYFHETKQCYIPPSEPTIRRILQSRILGIKISKVIILSHFHKRLT